MAFAAGRCYQGGVAPFPRRVVKPAGVRDARSSQDLQGAVFASRFGLGGPHPQLDREASAARLSQVEAVARALVSTYAADDTGAADFTVELMPDALSAALAAAAAAREGAVRSPVQELVTRRRLARQLYVEGLEVADIGAALGVSSRRVQLLISEGVSPTRCRSPPRPLCPSPPSSRPRRRRPGRRRHLRPGPAVTDQRPVAARRGPRPTRVPPLPARSPALPQRRGLPRGHPPVRPAGARPRPRRHGHRPGAPAHPGARGPRGAGQGRHTRRHAPSRRQPGPHHPGLAAASRRAGQAHGRPVRGVAEPLWPGRHPVEHTECHLHETMLNLAFARGTPLWLRCAYGVDHLSDAEIRFAAKHHPVLVPGSAPSRSGGPLGNGCGAEPSAPTCPRPGHGRGAALRPRERPRGAPTGHQFRDRRRARAGAHRRPDAGRVGAGRQQRPARWRRGRAPDLAGAGRAGL